VLLFEKKISVQIRVNQWWKIRDNVLVLAFRLEGPILKFWWAAP
jgi:hypothetical protein